MWVVSGIAAKNGGEHDREGFRPLSTQVGDFI
jgi:hypothetical protein